MKTRKFIKSYYLYFSFFWSVYILLLIFYYYFNHNDQFIPFILIISSIWLIGIASCKISYNRQRKWEDERDEALNQLENVKNSLEEKVRDRTHELYLSKNGLEEEINERKIIEEKLKNSELRYRNIIEHSSNLFYSHDVNHNLTYLSPQTEKFFDCSQDEAKIRWTEFISDNSVNDVGFKLTEAAINTACAQIPYDLELVTKKGRKLWVEVHEAPILKDGKTIAIVGALIDISNWKHTSDALALSEVKFRELFENAPDGIIHLNKAGFILNCNKAFAKLLGFEIKDLLNNHVTTTFASSHKRDFNEKISILKKEGSLKIEEIHLLNKSKDIIKVRRSANAIYNEDGKFNGIIVYTHDITEFLNLRKSLVESEKVLQNSQKIAGIGSFKFDIENSIWQTTEVLNDILEIDSNYPKSLNSWLKLVHFLDRKKLRNIILDVINKNEKRFKLNHRIVTHRDKLVKWVSFVGEIEIDKNGQIISLTGSLQDITEKYLSDLRIKESEEHLRRIITAADGVSFMTTTAQGEETVILDVSLGSEKIFGYNREELLGMKVKNLHLDEDVANFDSNLEKMKNGKIGFMGEILMVRKSGESFPAFHKAFSIKSENGNVSSLLGVTVDLSEVKEARKDLAKREEQLSTLINASPDIIYFKDGDGKWLLANDAVIELFQLQNVEYFGKSDFELSHISANHKETLLKSIESDEIAWAYEKSSRLVEIIKTENGLNKVFDIIKVPVFHKNGLRNGLVVLGRDITKKTELENRLVRAKKMEAVGLMASRLAHEFKNILQSITGYSHFAQKGLEKNDGRYQDIEEVIKAALRADFVVKNLLKSGVKFNLIFKRINIHELLNEFVNSNKNVFGDEFEIVYLFEQNLEKCFVNCDKIHLEMVMYNICLNAIDAMPSGGIIKIESKISNFGMEKIQFFDWLEVKEFFTISIEDSGIGMSKETIDNLYEPFFTTKSIEKGTGLGLSSAYDIIKSHGGFIDVKSQLGMGSKFFINIPLVV
jgi:PAS domain S-box-containing protein